MAILSRFPKRLNTPKIMPILVVTEGQTRQPVVKGRRKGPEMPKSLREGFVKI
jgi:hypothetical protein